MSMELTEVSNRVKDELQELSGNKNWTRGLAAGSLITGAVLLATGKRKAGFAVTALGAVVALLEDQENMREIWERLPHYIQTSQHFLGRFEGFITELAQQGDRIRSVMGQRQV